MTNIQTWSVEEISKTIKSFVTTQQIKFPHIAQPLRIAVSGTANTPSIDVTLQLVGQKRALERIDKAIKYFSKSV